MAASVGRPRGRQGPQREIASSIGKVVAYILLIVFAVAIIYPLAWMLLNGFKSNAELFGDAWGLPTTWRWENFAKAWNLGVVRYLLNSVIVTGASVVLTVLLSSMAAYALTRLRIPFAGPITVILLGGMLLSPTVALIPLFKLIQGLGIFNTYWALIILYTAFRIPFTVFLIRAYMVTLSREVEDAATVDGANRCLRTRVHQRPRSQDAAGRAAGHAGSRALRLAGPVRGTDDGGHPHDRPVPAGPAAVHPRAQRRLREVGAPT